VNKTEETLKTLGKSYEFHRYDGAGHAFLNWGAASFRSAAAADAWPKIHAFYAKHLGGGTTGSATR
jgi:carboxymethylenebutenolidase